MEKCSGVRMLKSVVMILVLFAAFFAMTLSASGEEGRYVKLDENGEALSQDASQWAMIMDNTTGLIWEVKTEDGSQQDKDNLYKWTGAEEYIATLNSNTFGGFSDWRMPNKDEIYTIREKNNDPHVDTAFFPNTVAARYWTYYICGDGSFISEKVKFGKKKKRTKGYRVRAVRGTEL